MLREELRSAIEPALQNINNHPFAAGLREGTLPGEVLVHFAKQDSEYLLPSHGPVFRRDPAIIQKAIDRLTGYQYMADFGTCAVDWPLLHEWEADVTAGRLPKF